MTTRLAISFMVLICVVSTLATAAGPKQGVRKGSTPYLCGQVQMHGNAGGSYANAQACTAAKPQLQTNAVTNGNDQCKNFCTSLGCREETIPDPLTAAAACKGPDPANQKWYGRASTGQFDCKCLNP